MGLFIANSIEKAYDEGGVSAGRDMYKAYFGQLPIYNRYRAQVDLILKTDGYDECIVG